MYIHNGTEAPIINISMLFTSCTLLTNCSSVMPLHEHWWWRGMLFITVPQSSVLLLVNKQSDVLIVVNRRRLLWSCPLCSWHMHRTIINNKRKIQTCKSNETIPWYNGMILYDRYNLKYTVVCCVLFSVDSVTLNNYNGELGHRNTC